MSGIVTLLGAGELMAATSPLHRAALGATKGPAKPIFLDTTAGYESNIEAIAAKAVEYYRHHLQQDMAVASYRHGGSATPAVTAAAVAAIRAANYIFAGPGSPTYALSQWRDSPVLEAIAAQYDEHAHLFFASAASITLGRYTLPVYEIYKAGQDPFWADGLDFLGRIGLNVAIVPHFNDNSGGENYDSRYCYMGARRFDILQELLPTDVTILGLDAYTALTIDHHQATATVSGQGGLTVIGQNGQQRYGSGETVGFDALQSAQRSVIATQDERQFAGYEYADEAADATSNADALTAYIESLDMLPKAHQVEILARIEGLKESANGAHAGGESADRLADLILELRQALRQAGQYELADKARDGLIAAGYEIADSPQGSTASRID